MRARAVVVGALWGACVAGLLTARLEARDAFALLAAGALLGALAAPLSPRAAALDHPFLASLAAGAGVAMARLPEPSFFLLVPLIAAAVAWPFGGLARQETARDTLPRRALPATFALAAAVFFLQSADRDWTYASGSKDLGLF